MEFGPIDVTLQKVLKLYLFVYMQRLPFLTICE